MKYLFIGYISILISHLLTNSKCGKLTDGLYTAHFTEGLCREYKIRIKGEDFVQYLNGHDSAIGKIGWIYDCIFEMKYSNRNDMDSITGPLKAMYDSWGPPCVELEKVKNDTIEFRTTHSRNLHITINKGYFLRNQYQAY